MKTLEAKPAGLEIFYQEVDGLHAAGTPKALYGWLSTLRLSRLPITPIMGASR
jgi:hypothetical protein